VSGESPVPTPYAVHCPRCGMVYLTSREYAHQMLIPDVKWKCPTCGRISIWSDANYEEWLEKET
jgi:endogenous inhibitor of DNA gyrase (YacG/DUF329 family)